MTDREPAPKALYVHIPFCMHKCFYCDFNTYALEGQPVMDYLQAMEQEMKKTVEEVPPGEIETIFIGGGTPTALNKEEMTYLLSLIDRYFPQRAPQLEFTSEANPGTTDDEKLGILYEGGVNRMSFGVQTFQNQLLKSIGRIHDAQDVYRSLETARKVGFQNVSIDLMFGLPRQTIEHVQESLARALELGLTHYSLYGLKVEERTLFHTLYERNELPLPEEEQELRMYEWIMQTLSAAGYRQYEISNFAIPGYESRHNQMYWRNQRYYGIGAGAHGYMDGTRHVNVKGVKAYMEAARQGLPRLERFAVSREEAMEDFMMVGLRMLDGVRQQDFVNQFGCSMESVFGDVIRHLLQKKWLVEQEEGYRIATDAIPIGNEIFAAFVGVLTAEKTS
ncbi:radical SAM family heme chaperone HemW [Marinicrinis sediminis]|uniref:Heme chaperone HemW n=1 Tax=Marinicrinis sediminis TaxID=1652465 RepID=A0ABW5R9F6_9BACL